MKNLTSAHLEKFHACREDIIWFKSAFPDGGSPSDCLDAAIAAGKHEYANWMMVMLLNRKDKLRYAVFAAELALKKHEKPYPKDKLFKTCIKAAKAVIKSDTKKNREAAGYAARSASGSAESFAPAAAGYAAAWSAASYAESFAPAAAGYAAAWSAWSARATWSAASYAAKATSDESAAMEKILRYGLTLLDY